MGKRAMGLDDAGADVSIVRACALGASHPECGSHPDNSGLFKIASSWGGARAGSGPKRKPPSVVVGPGVAGLRWYCVEVQPRQEVAVAEALLGLRFAAVAPQFMDVIPADAARRRPAREVLRPAFPGYGVVEFDAADPEWRRIASVVGVKRIMGSAPERPTPLLAVQAAWILGQFGVDGAQTRSTLVAAAPIAVGGWVRVVAGPLDGMLGHVVASTGRAVVLLTEGGHRVRMAQAAVAVCA